MGSKYTIVSNIKIINLDHAITAEIEPLVQEDNHKFCLQNKDSLLRKFIVYRLANFIIKTIENNRNSGNKLLFYMQKQAELDFLQDYNLFIYNMFIKLSNILSLSIYSSPLSIEEFTDLLHNNKGEGREARMRVNFIFNRRLKAPNIEKFIKLLNKHGIHKIEGDLNTGFKLKLGLFVT